jgi:deazaflavin-dependent oxidoreductase (nitroreductase family)
MTLEGEYAPSTAQWVRDQVEQYERSGGQNANTLRDTGLPVIVVTMRGNKSGKIRKIALMRVEHEGKYALVASRGGAPKHPVWYYNLVANPEEVTIQDGAKLFEARVRELSGDERRVWWERAVAAYPPYAEYQRKTERQIPVFVATRKSDRPGA